MSESSSDGFEFSGLEAAFCFLPGGDLLAEFSSRRLGACFLAGEFSFFPEKAIPLGMLHSLSSSESSDDRSIVGEGLLFKVPALFLPGLTFDPERCFLADDLLDSALRDKESSDDGGEFGLESLLKELFVDDWLSRALRVEEPLGAPFCILRLIESVEVPVGEALRCFGVSRELSSSELLLSSNVAFRLVRCKDVTSVLWGATSDSLIDRSTMSADLGWAALLDLLAANSSAEEDANERSSLLFLFLSVFELGLDILFSLLSDFFFLGRNFTGRFF